MMELDIAAEFFMCGLKLFYEDFFKNVKDPCLQDFQKSMVKILNDMIFMIDSKSMMKGE